MTHLIVTRRIKGVKFATNFRVRNTLSNKWKVTVICLAIKYESNF